MLPLNIMEKPFFIKGKLDCSWSHVNISAKEFINNKNMEINWKGDALYISEISFKINHNQEKIFKRSQKNDRLVLDSMLAKNIGLLSGKNKGESYTPYIDEFFKNGIAFKNSYSVSEYTMPSLSYDDDRSFSY